MSLTATNLLDYDRGGIRQFLASLGEKEYRGDQVLKWIYHRGITDFEAMTNLSKSLRSLLLENADIRLPEVADSQRSIDGTRKWLYRLDDGNSIETVYIPDENRGTLCVSSQVGCALNCSFCATGREGFSRNLTVSEIISQVYLASRELAADVDGEYRSLTPGLTNVVMMGMGEPLLNFDNVVTAMNLMQDDFSFGLSRRRITLSTAGIVPMIDRLRQASPVSLAVSLHAPEDQLRERLVPLNKKYPISEVMAACKRYVAGEPRKKVTFEYTMIKGVNDSLDLARKLLRRLEGVPSKVNLIPFNPFPGSSYRSASQEQIDAFRDILMKGGVMTITRKTRGGDIDAACGQLVGRFEDRTRRSQGDQQDVNLIAN